MSSARQALVGSPLSEPVAAVFSHNYGEEVPSEARQFEDATQLYSAASGLAGKITEEAEAEQDFFGRAGALALTFSTLCALCDKYSCPKECKSSGKDSSAMQVQAIEGLKTVSGTIVNFVNHIDVNTQNVQDIDRVSPIIMDALYSAAANYAWMVRESGDEVYQNALDAIRICLRKLGTRWRNAAEYVRILEAQEFSYAVGSAS
jgi:hypothetical protein